MIQGRRSVRVAAIPQDVIRSRCYGKRVGLQVAISLSAARIVRKLKGIAAKLGIIGTQRQRDMALPSRPIIDIVVKTAVGN